MKALNIHKKACAFADTNVPEFKVDSPEHYFWLLCYEVEKRRLLGTIGGVATSS